jgi:hypothetical protein
VAPITKISAAAGRREAVFELVRSHTQLDPDLAGAIWLATKQDSVWLLEVVPTLPPDEYVEEPIEFLPSRAFRYGLRLIAGRETDLLRAIGRSVGLANAVANGLPIPRENTVTRRLRDRARKTLATATQ